MELSGLPFKMAVREIDERGIEDQNPDKSAEEIVTMLAIAKAQAVASDFPDDVVVAADTFAVLPNGQRLHKTKTFEESVQLSMQQSGKTMEVHTGMAMVRRGELLTNSIIAQVTYAHFDEATVRHLFQINQTPKRRNAALGFFADAPGFTLVEKIEGSYLGAMGLPMEIVRANLERLDYRQS